MVSYSTNWMGPIAMWWFRDNGFTKIITKKLEKDNKFTNQKAGKVVEVEEITQHWYGGRIDIYGLPEDEYYCGTSEISLPIMDGKSWKNFSEWLETFETETEWTLEAIVAEFEKNHDKIVWFKEENKGS